MWRLPSPVSIVRGKCLIISSLLAGSHCHPSCRRLSLCPISDGETKGLVAEEYVQINMLKVGLGMDSLLCTLLFVWQQIVKVPAGAATSCHQWPAIQMISISCSHSSDTNTSFRSQQITFEKLTACYHCGWWEDFISCSFL